MIHLSLIWREPHLIQLKKKRKKRGQGFSVSSFEIKASSMAIAKENKSDQSEGKLWNLCRMPFWQHNPAAAAASSGGGTISGGPSAGGSGAGSGASSSSSLVHHPVGGGSHHYSHISNHLSNLEGPTTKRQVNSSTSITTVARSLLPASARRKLRLDPSTKMYFPCKL